MKHNILIVDDDEVTLTSLSAFLRGEGFFVKTVTSGDEAIALVRQKAIPFSLALIDYHMPEMNGPAVISGIREYCQSLHLVGFSGDDSNESHNERLKVRSCSQLFIGSAARSRGERNRSNCRRLQLTVELSRVPALSGLRIHWRRQ
jgi:CheY-like chemotaxis protein